MRGIGTSARVCVIIPHFECEEWLAGALESLLDQTRPPDAIVVVDDCSPEPPVDVVAAYRQVTLLSAPDNGGPYRLVQAVMDATRFDAYLFQDADDWSAPDRLEALLEEAERTGAELIGSHEVRVLVEQNDLVPVRYPLDVNAALEERPTSFPLLHPTSLVARTLVERVGGFATGMRFSGDAEFLRRAAHAGRVVNADHFGYFRRKRTGSLTTAPDTALNSPARLQVQQELAERARRNAERAAAGGRPDLRPHAVAPPVQLRHLAGPALEELSPRRVLCGGWEARKGSGSTAGRRSDAPVFVIGPPGAGHSTLVWALAQHPSFHPVVDGRWLARCAADVHSCATEEAAPAPAGFFERMAAALADVAAAHGRRWLVGGSELTSAGFALAQLFPNARFLHVVRDLAGSLAALASVPTDGGAYLTTDLATRHWVAAVETGLALESALGRERILRVGRDDLLEASEDQLRACLAFLGEDFTPGCLRPLTGADEPFRMTQVPQLPEGLAAAARRLGERLDSPQPLTPSPAEAARLADEGRRRRTGPRGRTLVEKVRELVVRAARPGAVAAVVSRGDPRLTRFPEVTGWHFPQVADGTYAGYYPEDARTAIAHLEELRARGAEYLVFPATSLWWLTYYEGLHRHLEERYRLVAFEEDAGAVWVLAPRSPAHPDEWSPTVASYVPDVSRAEPRKGVS